jgi:DNA processing protein
MQTHLQTDVLYLYALGLLKGIGHQTLVRIARTIPDLSELPQMPLEMLQEHLGTTPGTILAQSFHHTPAMWQDAREQAERELSSHLEQGIVPLPLTHAFYPPLLKLIADPPPILYAKGNIPLLRDTRAVAIVGTRQPTSTGIQVAHELAYRLAQRQYTIVSGLAKGIDCAAHQGALDAQGKTIAVFGTPLDTVYPAEHRDLAERILSEYGVIVSEMALGQRTFPTAFVRRDRIQSGLSLAVLPIQTRNDGGTMHTVQFARTQNRLIICPRPPSAEAQARQYEGIRTLINEGAENTHSFLFHRLNYGKLLSLFQAKSHELLPAMKENQIALATELFPSPSYTSVASLILDVIEENTPPLQPSKKKPRRNIVAESTLPLLSSSTQRILPAVREIQEPFLPSPQLAQTQILFGGRVNENGSEHHDPT